jgi:hypothetical protein
MKQIAALVAIMLAALAALALILRIGATLSGHRGGGMAFVVADNIAPSHRQGVQIRPHTDPMPPYSTRCATSRFWCSGLVIPNSRIVMRIARSASGAST